MANQTAPANAAVKTANDEIVSMPTALALAVP
jgi:hypothetical protein